MAGTLTPLRSALNDGDRFDFEHQNLIDDDEANELGKTLRAARKRFGVTQEKLAADEGVSRQTIANWERGVHTPDLETLKRLEKRFDLRPGTLTAGLVSRVTVLGYVAAGDHGAEAIYDPHPLPIEDILLPFASEPRMAWLQVRGSSMMPLYREGDLIAYDSEAAFSPEDCLRRLCVIQTGDERVLVKTVMPGSSHGRYDLISTNADAITDQVLVWASPVKAAFYK